MGSELTIRLRSTKRIRFLYTLVDRSGAMHGVTDQSTGQREFSAGTTLTVLWTMTTTTFTLVNSSKITTMHWLNYVKKFWVMTHGGSSLPRERAGRDHLNGYEPKKAPKVEELPHIQKAAYDYYDNYWKGFWQRLYDKHGFRSPRTKSLFNGEGSRWMESRCTTSR